MSSVLVEHDPSPLKLEVLGVDDWPLTVEAVSVRDAVYPHSETQFIVSGCAEITPHDAPPVVVRGGDLLTFLPGAKCRWNITETLEKHTHPDSPQT